MRSIHRGAFLLSLLASLAATQPWRTAAAQFLTYDMPWPYNTSLQVATDLVHHAGGATVFSSYNPDPSSPDLPSAGLVTSVDYGLTQWSLAITGDSSQFLLIEDSLFFGGLVGQVHAMDLDDDEHLLICGRVFSHGRMNAMVASLDQDGDTLWSSLLGADVAGPPAFYEIIHLDDGGAFAVGGHGDAWNDSSNVIWCRYSASGELLWARDLEVPLAPGKIRCFQQDGALTIFLNRTTGPASSTVTVARFAGSGELITTRELTVPADLHLLDVCPGPLDGFILLCDSADYIEQPGASGLLLLRMDADLQPVGEQVKILVEHAMLTSSGTILYDAPNDRVFVSHISIDGVDGPRPFVFCWSYAEHAVLWARMVHGLSVSGLHSQIVDDGPGPVLHALTSPWSQSSLSTMRIELDEGLNRTDSACSPYTYWHFNYSDTAATSAWAEIPALAIEPVLIQERGLSITDVLLFPQVCSADCTPAWPPAFLPIPQPVLVGDPILLTVTVPYGDVDWQLPDGWVLLGLPNDTTASVLVGGEADQEVPVCVGFSDGICTGGICQTVFVDGQVGHASHAMSPAARAFPNPADERFTLELDPLVGSVEVGIFDAAGRTLFLDSYRSAPVPVDVDMLPSGTDLVRWRSATGTGAIPLFVRH